MAIYGYARVSTLLQNTDRQIEELKKFGVKEKNLYVDKLSGKTFDRANYKKLIKKISKGDLIVVKSLDRLGRNYDMIIGEWKKITIKLEVDICVIDMPVLDTREKSNGLVGKFISDIVLQVLSFVAENERINISQRTKEGLHIAKLKGKKLGRPIKSLPNHSNLVFNSFINKTITCDTACEQLKISKATFYKNLKQYTSNSDIYANSMK